MVAGHSQVEQILDGTRMPSSGASSAPMWDPATLQLVLKQGESLGLPVWQDFVDRALAKMTRFGQRIAARAIVFLVTPDGHTLTQTAEDLAALISQPPLLVRDALTNLVAAGMLRLERRAGGPESYTVAHDVLAPNLFRWSHKWLTRDRRRRQILAWTVCLTLAGTIIALIVCWVLKR